MAKTAADVSAKWRQNTANAQSSITNGVNAVTTSPAQQAAASADLWQQRVQDPAVKEKFQRSLAKVTLEQWRQAMIQKGIPRIASGVANAQGKFQDFMAKFLPHVQNVAAQVRTMPKNTLEDRIARAAAQIRGNASFRNT